MPKPAKNENKNLENVCQSCEYQTVKNVQNREYVKYVDANAKFFKM